MDAPAADGAFGDATAAPADAPADEALTPDTGIVNIQEEVVEIAEGGGDAPPPPPPSWA